MQRLQPSAFGLRPSAFGLRVSPRLSPNPPWRLHHHPAAPTASGPRHPPLPRLRPAAGGAIRGSQCQSPPPGRHRVEPRLFRFVRLLRALAPDGTACRRSARAAVAKQVAGAFAGRSPRALEPLWPALSGLGGPVLQRASTGARATGRVDVARGLARGPERLGPHRRVGPRLEFRRIGEACVRAGLNEVYLGIERPDAEGLASLHKTSGVADARAALQVLRERFPQVLAVGSFIYGLPGDTPASVRAIHQLAVELELDQFFFIPLTPLPGAAGWTPELWDPSRRAVPRIQLPAHRPPHGRHAQLERALLWSLLTHWPAARVRSYARQLFCGDTRRRRVQRRLALRGAQFHLGRILKRVFGGKDEMGLIFPRWYEG